MIKNKEQQIEDLAKLFCSWPCDCSSCDYNTTENTNYKVCVYKDRAEKVYAADYRRRSDVAAEFADMLKTELLDRGLYPVFVKNAIAEVLRKMTTANI
jgi:hypothetical protein